MFEWKSSLIINENDAKVARMSRASPTSAFSISFVHEPFRLLIIEEDMEQVGIFWLWIGAVKTYQLERWALATCVVQAAPMFELWEKMDLVNFGLMQEENSKVVDFFGALMVEKIIHPNTNGRTMAFPFRISTISFVETQMQHLGWVSTKEPVRANFNKLPNAWGIGPDCFHKFYYGQARRLIHEHAGKNRGKDSWCTMGHNLMKRPAATLILLVDKTLQQFFDGETTVFGMSTGERQLYQQALSAFQRGEDENMAKICEAYMLAQEAMLGIFGCLWVD